MEQRKCIFLDRDGVLNEEIGTYVFRLDDLVIPQGAKEALSDFKKSGYMLIVITNQSGIAKGLYTESDVWECHRKMQEVYGGLLDDLYFCRFHPDHDTESLLRKPDSLMIEKALSKYSIDTQNSWMIGDKWRDVEAGKKVGVNTVFISGEINANKGGATFQAINLWEASQMILKTTI